MRGAREHNIRFGGGGVLFAAFCWLCTRGEKLDHFRTPPLRRCSAILGALSPAHRISINLGVRREPGFGASPASKHFSRFFAGTEHLVEKSSLFVVAATYASHHSDFGAHHSVGFRSFPRERTATEEVLHIIAYREQDGAG